MDRLTKKQRSFNMSRVRSKNTKPEELMFKMLGRAGYKFQKHYGTQGKPDIAFPDSKIAVFIDGEFWHGKNFTEWCGKLTPFWLKKIKENIMRDRKNSRLLRIEGWHILHFWDKKIIKNPEKAFSRLVNFIERKRSR